MDLKHLADLFARVADAAAADPAVAEAVREALAQSRLLDVFGAGEALDVVDLLDVGGEEALRVRLRQMTLSELKQIVALRNYDPDK
ncbi:MAG TPA: hypothetical protein VGS80_25850, partial [Ktedonobacterales bacterium]|nr:hypothetical protein [Ktedonobacterales bacterium]